MQGDVRIPFNRPSIEGRELKLIQEAVANGHISGDGTFTRQASAMLETITGGGRILLTTSCTDALEMSAILFDVEPGDEVIVPAFTFVSGVNAFVLRGARPVFADIRRDTLNVDETIIESLVSEKTRVVAPVHYAGVGCEIERIMEIASRWGAHVVEDNAHGLFASFRGRPLGSYAPLATQSFHETKNINCGEGGALVVNDPSLIERAEIIREKGTNRTKFSRGLVDKYTWVDLGSSYLMSDLLAAYLVAQLEQREVIQAKRKQVWTTYQGALSAWGGQHGVRLPFVPAHCEQPYHMFYLIMQSFQDRESLRRHLLTQGIVAAFHYVPLNTTPFAARYGATAGQCPVAEEISDRLLRLPFYNGMIGGDQNAVIDAVLSWRS